MQAMSQVVDTLENARNAAARQAWKEAYAAYAEAVAAALEAVDLEQYGDAAWWSGKLDEAIALRERSYGAYLAAGERVAAARIAITLSWDHHGRGAFAVSRGWLASAERLLDGEPESSEHGFLGLTKAVDAMFAGDLDAAIPALEEVHALGRRLGDRDTEALALTAKGRALVTRGEVEQGLALLEEATAICGVLRPYATGLVYCMSISASQDIGDYRRAAEWTEVANRWCDQLDVTGFPGACRIHRAEALRLRGDWPAAEAQAVAACEELHDFDRLITAGGYYELGEIRRRRGDFAGAEEAYRQANELGRDPQPGLALLRLAEGKVEAAVAAIRRTLAELEDPLSRLRALPAQVDISLAAGDTKSARVAAEELERLVDSYKIGGQRADAFDATVHYAWGRIELAERDLEAATKCLRRSRDGWKRVGAPYEVALARLQLGVAYRRAGDEHGANAELEAALTEFERLGAQLDAARTAELLGRVASRRTFLFTDIVDSTKLVETLGDAKWRKLLARHDELVQEVVAERGGEVVKKTGDGFFLAFEQPRAAIEAAVAIQRALADEIVAPDVRIGLHACEAFRDGEAADYGGQGVHAAARIGAVAGAGEILVSKETLDGTASSYRASEPRSLELKGIAEPVEVVAVDWR
jgi:class 3 adenylate cyclase